MFCCGLSTEMLEDVHYKNLRYFLFTNTRLLLSVAVEMRERHQLLSMAVLNFYNLFYCVTLVMGSYKQLCFNFFLLSLLYFICFNVSFVVLE